MLKGYYCKYSVERLNRYGYSQEKLYEGDDIAEALTIYYEEIISRGHINSFAIYEYRDHGLRTYRYHKAGPKECFCDEPRKPHPQQDSMDEWFDSIPEMKSGGL